MKLLSELVTQGALHTHSSNSNFEVPQGVGFVFFLIVLCYAMLCYVMLCYVILCYVVLCYIMLCYVLLCYVVLCFVMLCFVMLCCLVLCCVFCCVVISCVMLCVVLLYCDVMWCAVLCCVVPSLTTLFISKWSSQFRQTTVFNRKQIVVLSVCRFSLHPPQDPHWGIGVTQRPVREDQDSRVWTCIRSRERNLSRKTADLLIAHIPFWTLHECRCHRAYLWKWILKNLITWASRADFLPSDVLWTTLMYSRPDPYSRAWMGIPILFSLVKSSHKLRRKGKVRNQNKFGVTGEGNRTYLPIE